MLFNSKSLVAAALVTASLLAARSAVAEIVIVVPGPIVYSSNDSNAENPYKFEGTANTASISYTTKRKDDTLINSGTIVAVSQYDGKFVNNGNIESVSGVTIESFFSLIGGIAENYGKIVKTNMSGGSLGNMSGGTIGTINLSGSGVVVNSGTITTANVDGGMYLSNPTGYTDKITVENGSVLSSGTIKDLVQNGGTVANNGSALVNNATINAGTFTNGANATVQFARLYENGKMTNNGTISVFAEVNGNSTLTNTGTIQSVNQSTGGTIINNNGGHILSWTQANNDTTTTATNYGTVGFANVSGTFDNFGNIEILSPQNGGTATNSGTIGEVWYMGGTFINNGSVDLLAIMGDSRGQGNQWGTVTQLEFDPGGVLALTGDYSAGSFDFSGIKVLTSVDLTNGHVVLNLGGDIDFGASFSVSDIFGTSAVTGDSLDAFSFVGSYLRDGGIWRYSGGTFTYGAVPEPTSLSLLALGAGGLLLRRRKH